MSVNEKLRYLLSNELLGGFTQHNIPNRREIFDNIFPIINGTMTFNFDEVPDYLDEYENMEQFIQELVNDNIINFIEHGRATRLLENAFDDFINNQVNFWGRGSSQSRSREIHNPYNVPERIYRHWRGYYNDLFSRHEMINDIVDTYNNLINNHANMNRDQIMHEYYSIVTAMSMLESKGIIRHPSTGRRWSRFVRHLQMVLNIFGNMNPNSPQQA